tara:strand:- start:24 stop:1247 length:1224 start_codon:yes stop_codon:yes gene_type:complete
MIPLIEKYRVKKFEDIKGQDAVVEEVRGFYRDFPKKKALILNGVVGVGKTSMALALANENGLELFELNASDLRNRASLEEVLKPALAQESLFSKSKLILMDEADGITGSDRGGVVELIRLIEESNYPIVITANNIWDKKFSGLRKKCKIIELKEIDDISMKRLLMGVLFKEGKQLKVESVDLIVKNVRGDIRAGLNDLQSIIDLGEESYKEGLIRDKGESIFNVLKRLFQEEVSEETLRIFDSVNLNLDEILLWIEENLGSEYAGEDLMKAIDALSRSDIFKGRIYRQQYWRFLVYQNFFMSAGISASSKLKNKSFVSYKRPSRILKIWMANQRNAKLKSVMEKYSKFCHMSKKKASKDKYLLPFILEGIDDGTRNKMDLSEEELSYINEKKVDFVVSSGLNRFRVE